MGDVEATTGRFPLTSVLTHQRPLAHPIMYGSGRFLVPSLSTIPLASPVLVLSINKCPLY